MFARLANVCQVDPYRHVGEMFAKKNMKYITPQYIQPAAGTNS